MPHTFPLNQVKFPLVLETNLSGSTNKKLLVRTTILGAERPPNDPIVDFVVQFKDLSGSNERCLNQMKAAVDYYNELAD